MGAIRGRATRASGEVTVLFQTRTKPEIRKAINDAAARNGVSTALYHEALMNHLLDETGALPYLEGLTRRPDEELPIPVT